MDQAITVHAPLANDVAASPVVELRQYTLRPGRRAALMDLFERKFVDGQRAVGIRLHGEFRDSSDPDRFVWLRGFSSLEDRPRALASFYYGEAWKEHRAAANATMVDSDNVLLLEPVQQEGFTLARRMGALMVATIYRLRAPADDEFTRFFSARVEPVMRATGAPSRGELRTLHAPNDFPALPVREGENAFVWFAAYGSRAEYERHLARLSQSKLWGAVEPELTTRLVAAPVVLELEPTAGTLRRNQQDFDYRLDRSGNVHDFDFLAGSWVGVSRKLATRAAASHDWESFPLEWTNRPLLGGMANVEEISFPTQGFSGVSLRTFDPQRKQWSIYRVDSRSGTLQPAVVGGFEGDVGLFYGQEVDAGRPVKAVYRYTRMGPNAARWEQAFSYDDGRTWETHWVMEFERRPIRAAAQATPSPVRVVHERRSAAITPGKREFAYRLDHTGDLHDFDFLTGTWTGLSRKLARRGVGSHEWESFTLRSNTRSLLHGAVNVEEIVFPSRGFSGIALRTFDGAKKQWSIHWVDSRSGLVQPPVVGGFEGDVGLFYGEDVDAGRPVKAAFRWTRASCDAARWEQAFSYDDGRTWETNWVMEFERADRYPQM